MVVFCFNTSPEPGGHDFEHQTAPVRSDLINMNHKPNPEEEEEEEEEEEANACMPNLISSDIY